MLFPWRIIRFRPPQPDHLQLLRWDRFVQGSRRSPMLLAGQLDLLHRLQLLVVPIRIALLLVRQATDIGPANRKALLHNN